MASAMTVPNTKTAVVLLLRIFVATVVTPSSSLFVEGFKSNHHYLYPKIPHGPSSRIDLLRTTTVTPSPLSSPPSNHHNHQQRVLYPSFSSTQRSASIFRSNTISATPLPPPPTIRNQVRSTILRALSTLFTVLSSVSQTVSTTLSSIYTTLLTIGSTILSTVNQSILTILAAASGRIDEFNTVLGNAFPLDVKELGCGLTDSLQGSLLFATSIGKDIWDRILSVTLPPKQQLLKAALLLFLLYSTTTSIIDTVQTRRRQEIDATSEWGRYADYPAVRGRALFALMGRIAPYSIAALVLNRTLGRRNAGGGGGGGGGGSEESGESGTKADSSTTRTETDGSNDNRWSRRASELRTTSGSIFADGLLRLGPLYIKMGQILSCRPDLLPDEWKVSMERLQDRVPAKSGQDAYDLVYEAYGGKKSFDEIFCDFDDVPIAAASLGQVHKARLRREPQEEVAIKVQRARLRDIYDKDLGLMNTIAKVVDDGLGRFGNVGGVKQSWVEIFRDAEEILYREIDYRDEAENAIRFAKDFGIGLGGVDEECSAVSLDGKMLPSAASWMRTPYIYNDLSNEKVLVMENVPSIKISDVDELRKAGVTDFQKEELAENLARAYLRQFCVNKFFSTDPHPGNLGVEVVEDEGGKQKSRLVFYDFGQACSLKDDQAGGILDVVEGIVDLNVDSCVSAFDRMGVLVEGADLDKIREKVQNNFDQGKLKINKKKAKMKDRRRVMGGKQPSLPVPASVNDNNDNTEGMNPAESKIKAEAAAAKKAAAEAAAKDINDIEIMSFFTLPAEYAFVARALSQMDGVGKDLDPDFDFISAAAPHLVEIKGGGKYVEDEMAKIVGRLGEQNGFLKFFQDFFESIDDFREDVCSFLRSQ